MKRRLALTVAAFVLLPLSFPGIARANSDLAVQHANSAPAAPRATCPHGETLVAPTSSRTDALGVRHFTYKAAPGMVASLPPRGLTAARVTPAMLADLGMPSRASARQHWAPRAARLAADQAPQEFCRSSAVWTPPVRRGAAAPSGQFGHVYSGTWAGYAITEPATGGESFNGVEGTWTQGQQHTVTSPSAEATWVGLGGGLGENGTCQSTTNPSGVACGLIQTGTSLETNKGYRSWFEYVGTGNTGINPVYSSINAVWPGDVINAEVYWVTTKEACFYLTNFTTGTGDISTCINNLPIPYDHTSAEWINEFPGWAAHYDNPGTIYWSGQATTGYFDGTGGWFSPFTQNFEAVVMDWAPTAATSCGSGNGVLSYPENARNDGATGASDTVTCAVNGIDSP